MAYLLLFVVLVEGFTTLAMQLVALRSAVPLVGSSIVLTSVVIGVILLALAIGYWYGGKLTARLSEHKIAQVLSWLLFGAAIYYIFLVFPLQQDLLLSLMQQLSYIPALFVFALLFFFVPVAAASHTMPMITQLTSGNKGLAAGKILFVSTLGSFLGSVLTTTVLFPSLGVAQVGYMTAGLLLVCHIAMMIYQKRIPRVGMGGLIVALLLFIGRPKVEALYTHDSPYQHIEIQEQWRGDRTFRIMLLDGGYASSIDTKTSSSWFGYVRSAVEVTDSRNTLSAVVGEKKLLVIGAAGFTYPEEMARKEEVAQVDTVDVDPSVKPIAEKYFLQKNLHEKIAFFPQSARGFLKDAIAQKKHYDTILVDAYIGTSVPEELMTREFFADLKKISDSVILNMIMDTQLKSDFAQHALQTISSAWGSVWYKNVSASPSSHLANFLVTSRPFGEAMLYTGNANIDIYTDDKGSVEIDKVQMFYNK